MLATPEPERQAHRQVREGLLHASLTRRRVRPRSRPIPSKAWIGRSSLARLHLLATFHTGALLSEEVGFPIERFGSRLEVGDREQPSL